MSKIKKIYLIVDKESYNGHPFVVENVFLTRDQAREDVRKYSQWSDSQIIYQVDFNFLEVKRVR